MKSSLLIIILFSFILTGCNLYGPKKEAFEGTIDEINDKTAIVNVTESERSKLNGPVQVGLSANHNEKFQVGDKVRVEYDDVMEMSPIRVSTISIKKVK